MKTYFIGTTLEGLTTILNNQFIGTNSPEQNCLFTDNFIHMIPSKLKGEKRKALFTQAISNCNAAITTLNHTKRVVLEVRDIPESLVLEDKNNSDVHVFKYPFNISIGNIKRIYIDKHDVSSKIKEAFAVSELLKTKNTKYFETLRDSYYSGKDIEECDIPIANIEFLNLSSMLTLYEDSFDYFLDLLMEINEYSTFSKMKLLDFYKNNESLGYEM